MTVREAFENWLYTAPIETFCAPMRPRPEPRGLAFEEEPDEPVDRTPSLPGGVIRGGDLLRPAILWPAST